MKRNFRKHKWNKKKLVIIVETLIHNTKNRWLLKNGAKLRSQKKSFAIVEF